ncbi:hypothetical protein AMAG_15102 [Allomyces macrogynus ATCC 38327]|uniref:Uncharacterized protein n=1 Tax=Allomyces macrogynus (strain ATCC 38327) TaxID=578462 RepID=A0A0L0T610_ALLM3|nr:hypothetical protein AMAG_15102 [Allomyces macrogynus ATCC 38327]|eukprot:KNE70126.1 hypothetical protein AMAG_15102 [Allomyces macrogynus ATCC 38327]
MDDSGHPAGNPPTSSTSGIPQISESAAVSWAVGTVSIILGLLFILLCFAFIRHYRLRRRVGSGHLYARPIAPVMRRHDLHRHLHSENGSSVHGGASRATSHVSHDAVVIDMPPPPPPYDLTAAAAAAAEHFRTHTDQTIAIAVEASASASTAGERRDTDAENEPRGRASLTSGDSGIEQSDMAGMEENGPGSPVPSCASAEERPRECARE